MRQALRPGALERVEREVGEGIGLGGERVEREVGGGIGMGNTCKPMVVSFQCMTKYVKKKKKRILEKKIKIK